MITKQRCLANGTETPHTRLITTTATAKANRRIKRTRPRSRWDVTEGTFQAGTLSENSSPSFCVVFCCFLDLHHHHHHRQRRRRRRRLWAASASARSACLPCGLPGPEKPSVTEWGMEGVRGHEMLFMQWEMGIRWYLERLTTQTGPWFGICHLSAIIHVRANKFLRTVNFGAVGLSHFVNVRWANSINASNIQSW